MTIYTSENILQDILNFEGVEMVLPSNMQSGILYSQAYEKPCSNEAIVDDLKVRVLNYMQQYAYPIPDVQPDSTPGFLTIYALEGQTRASRTQL